MHNVHPLSLFLVKEKDYLTKTLSSMSFSTFGKRNKLVYFVLHSLNENLISNEVFFVRDKEQTSIQLVCSILQFT